VLVARNGTPCRTRGPGAVYPKTIRFEATTGAKRSEPVQPGGDVVGAAKLQSPFVHVGRVSAKPAIAQTFHGQTMKARACAVFALTRPRARMGIAAWQAPSPPGELVRNVFAPVVASNRMVFVYGTAGSRTARCPFRATTRCCSMTTVQPPGARLASLSPPFQLFPVESGWTAGLAIEGLSETGHGDWKSSNCTSILERLMAARSEAFHHTGQNTSEFHRTKICSCWASTTKFDWTDPSSQIWR